MKESEAEGAGSDPRRDNYLAAVRRLARNGGGQVGKGAGVGDARTPALRRSDAAVFQDLAAAGAFTPAELREAIDGLDLLRMSRTAPADFAAIAKDVGANVRGMDGPGAVREVVRAIMSGVKETPK